MNPYLPGHPWSPEVTSAYLSMPKNKFGHVVSLFYVLPNELHRLEGEWREWMRKHPRHLWPVWVKSWAEHKRKTAPIYVNGQQVTTESVNVP
jgi:hypothetical protein